MPDNVVEVRIIGKNETKAPLADSGADLQKYSEKVLDLGSIFDEVTGRITAAIENQTSVIQRGAEQWAGVRNEQEAVEVAWAQALEENAQRQRSAVHEHESAFEQFAESVAQFIEHPLQSAGQFAKELITDLGPVGTAAVVVGGALLEIAHKASELVTEEAAAAQATQNMAYRLGMTYEEAKHLSEVSSLVNVDLGILQRASYQLAAALESPMTTGRKTAEALTKLGVEGQNVGDLITNTFKKLSEIDDPTRRIAVAGDIFGRRASQMMQPLLTDWERLNAVVEGLGYTLDENVHKRLLEANEQIKAADVEWDRFKEKLASVIAPIKITVLRYITDVFSGSDPNKEANANKHLTVPKGWSEEDTQKYGTAISTMALARMTREDLANLREQAAARKEAAQRSAEYNEIIDKGYKDSAQRWKDQFEKTPEGMKSALGAVSREIKDLQQDLSNTMKPLDPEARVKKQEELNKALAEEHRLKALERAPQDTEKRQTAEIASESEHQKHLIDLQVIGYKEQEKLGRTWTADELQREIDANNQKLKITEQAARDKSAAEARAQRPGEGPSAATRKAELDKELQAARDATEKQNAEIQARIDEANEKREDDDKKLWGTLAKNAQKGQEKYSAEQIKQLGEANKKLEEREKAADIAATAEIAHGQRALTAEKDRLENEVKEGLITEREKVRQLDALEAKQLEHERRMAEINLAVAKSGDDPAKIASAQAALDKVTDQQALHAQQSAEHAAAGAYAPYKKYFDQIGHGFESTIDGMLRRQENFRQGMAKSLQNLEITAINSFLRIGAKWAEQKIKELLIHTATKEAEVATEQSAEAQKSAIDSETSMKSILNSAAGAAAKAYEALAGIPVVGPVLGAAAAAATFAGVMAYKAVISAEGGADLPNANTFAYLHPREMVLPQEHADTIRGLKGGGSRDVHFNYYGAPGESPSSIAANKKAFVKMAKAAMRGGHLEPA